MIIPSLVTLDDLILRESSNGREENSNPQEAPRHLNRLDLRRYSRRDKAEKTNV